MIQRIRYGASASLLALLACGSGATTEQAPPATPATPAPAAGAAETFPQQVAEGQALYASHCARCHGDHGEGGKGPRLVGLAEGALPLDPPATAKYRKGQFKTVADVAAFVVKAMPPDAPGSLGEPAYWSILAFDLKANGIDLGDKKLDGALAATLTIPRK